MSQTVLITGGAGFIGCHLSRALLQRGDRVVVFDNLHPQVHTSTGWPKDLPAGVDFISGDVTHAPNWETVFRLHRPEAIVHLAAETGTGQSLVEANRHAAVNVSGTAQLLDALNRIGHVPRQFVLTSSRAVYGDGSWRDGEGSVFYPCGRSREQLAAKTWNHQGPTGSPAEPLPSIAGKTHPNPISIYGATKLAQEQMLATWARAFGAGVTVLRLQNVYGPGQSVGNPYTGVLTLFARLARERRTLDIYEDGHIVRDFVHVMDVVAAILGTTAKPVNSVQTFDIGSGVPTTIGEVARQIAKLCNAPEPLVSGKFRDGDVRAASCVINDARQALGYEPKWVLEQGLQSVIDSIARTT